jgi:hypothetical protein
MRRYFFDVRAGTRIEYDYRGREFDHLDKAKEMAELIALDIGCSDSESTSFDEVQVRNVAGRRLFSLPMPPLDTIAA